MIQRQIPSLLRRSTFFLLFAIILAQAAATSSTTVHDDFGILEWIQSAPDGNIHPSQKYTKTGMIATDAIRKGEILATIPWSHILMKGENPDNREDEDEWVRSEVALDCAMVKALAREFELGSASSYAPLIMFLQDAAQRSPMNRLPSNWTEEGQILFRQIVHNFPPVEPTHWIAVDHYGHCQGRRKDVTAALLVVQWGNDGIVVPLLAGMYSHQNGKFTNADSKTSFGKKVEVVATRDIEAGETIFISHNLCLECSSRHSGYGTAEILRDYGFIESMPQRWHFNEDNLEFEIDYHNGSYSFQWLSKWKPDKPEEYEELKVGFGRQIRRQLKLKNIHYATNPGIPLAEWNTAWAFHDANIRAMMLARKALDLVLPHSPNATKPLHWHESEISFKNMPHYHSLDWEHDDVDYKVETCNNDEVMYFYDHLNVEKVATPYQRMLFLIEPTTKDVMLELDHVVQIASIYRPQYHEYVVHAAARFVDSVKRVIFIGGGDAMLLHEVLKYPELELVVGLELDQWVPRKSFQYFHTQPHFDDPRVEWWFGDATKSLLLLPKEYWQSFDLVLVDLSETVMSLSVTAELDVFDALALLLKPEGVLVKNEQYLNVVSRVFDYSIHIVYESPILCDQVLTMGSNGVDFLHAPVKDHGVPTLLYEPLVKETNRLDLLHDYRKKKTSKCDAPKPVITVDEQVRSAGILAIVDAEQVSIPLDETLVPVLENIIIKHGLELMARPVMESDFILMILKEGYILARLWPVQKWCSMDINLWGRFDRLHSLSTSLTSALKSPIVSSFRVVVGGMFGSSTWKDDRNSIGPQIVPPPECEDTVSSDDLSTLLPSPKELVIAAIDYTLEYVVQTENNIAVAICGLASEPCMTAELLEQSSKVSRVIRLSSCSTVVPNDNSTMYNCEKELAREWTLALGNNERTQLLMVDESAPYHMVQIIDSLLSFRSSLKQFIDESNVFVAWSTNNEPWRNHFLEYYRRHYASDPIRRADFDIQIGTDHIDFGIVACGNPDVAYSFYQVEANLQERFPPQILQISLDTIYGGSYPWLDPWEPKTFLQSDYDNQPGLDQYFSQKPLAHHVVFQLEPKQEGFDFSVQRLTSTFAAALKHVEFDCLHQSIYTDMGDGCIIVCLNPTLGSVVLSWDGRTHIDLSYYRRGSDTTSRHVDFVRAFSWVTTSLQVTLQDEIPRGIGRTINRVSDLRTPAERERFYEELLIIAGERDLHRQKLHLESMDDDEEEDDEEEDLDDEEDDFDDDDDNIQGKEHEL